MIQNDSKQGSLPHFQFVVLIIVVHLDTAVK
jgi:hypothetical protein